MQGVARSHKKAVEWCEKAAAQGQPEAQFSLGNLRREGGDPGVLDQSFPKAVEWYEKAGAQGHADANYNLGLMHRNGDGVQADDDAARRCFMKAAAQGHEPARACIKDLAKRRAATAKKKKKKNGGSPKGGGGWVRKKKTPEK